jgi:hypothetical protein
MDKSGRLERNIPISRIEQQKWLVVLVLVLNWIYQSLAVHEVVQ